MGPCFVSCAAELFGNLSSRAMSIVTWLEPFLSSLYKLCVKCFDEYCDLCCSTTCLLFTPVSLATPLYGCSTTGSTRYFFLKPNMAPNDFGAAC